MKSFSLVLVVIGFALLCFTLVTADDYEWDYEIVDSSVMTTTSSSSSPPSSSTVGPTTQPPPSSPKDLIYTLHDFNNNTQYCFNMSAVIQVVINETDQNGEKTRLNVTLSKEGTVGVVDDGSECKIENRTATIFIAEADRSEFSLVMMFNGTNSSWSLADMHMLVNGTALDGSGGMLTFNLNSSLDSKSKNLKSDRSFQCSKLKFQFSNASESPKNITPHVTMTDIKLQVFNFKDTDAGLGNRVTCAVDNRQGNKIVPIAVGAALAGLVIVVLIAYLIGRLRSRKQSSYEALS